MTKIPATVVTGLLAALAFGAGAMAQNEEQIRRGEYLVMAGGCTSCHTNEKSGGQPFAGGRGLETPFGTYYSPNITPDPQTGIGEWSDEDFVRALQEGVAPDGSHYFPVFPWTSYARMRSEDALAIKAYLFSLPPVSQDNKAHDVPPPFGWRWTMGIWKLLFFDQEPVARIAYSDSGVGRGAYLVEALAHCGECHTPRNLVGAMDTSMWLAGTPDGPDGDLVPNITPHETGIGDWSEGDIVQLLKTGLMPNYDNVQGSMQEAIEDGLESLTDEDLSAIAAYLKAIPAIARKVERNR